MNTHASSRRSKPRRGASASAISQPAGSKPAKKEGIKPAKPDMSHAPLPPAYDLAGVMAKLGFRNRQTVFESGLLKQLQRVPDTAQALYTVESVDEWALRLARLRILQAAGLRGWRGASSRASEAPAEADHDTTCPTCGAFALRLEKEIRCLNDHRIRTAPGTPTPPPYPR